MLKIGIIGTGKICQGVHLPAYDKIDDVEIVALCDIDENKLNSLKEKYPKARLYTDFEEMLNKEELDAVDICTPNNIHSKAAIYALNKGVNVMCEKPDAVSVIEAEKMKEAAEKSCDEILSETSFPPSDEARWVAPTLLTQSSG